MKLVIAIVQDEDAHKLLDKLMENNFGVTKLASTGGFLRSGNTTLIIGVQKEKVDEVLNIIKDLCKSRKQITSYPATTTWSMGSYVPYPVEVQVGGATVFVVDVEEFKKF
ncbi:cyclic-di-AMP receptor [Abyssisolibacter fermentans]|uniref:cyclic-di-AMP receptor n=1 Tax=Abyssisolibacter fermentans TaxID=1766203 RepID=UPI0008361B21|nr:cyclic-di-AMP receptor [Abyssisolibacter fermentans]